MGSIQTLAAAVVVVVVVVGGRMESPMDRYIVQSPNNHLHDPYHYVDIYIETNRENHWPTIDPHPPTLVQAHSPSTMMMTTTIAAAARVREQVREGIGKHRK